MKTARFVRYVLAFPTFIAALCAALSCVAVPQSAIAGTMVTKGHGAFMYYQAFVEADTSSGGVVTKDTETFPASAGDPATITATASPSTDSITAGNSAFKFHWTQVAGPLAATNTGTLSMDFNADSNQLYQGTASFAPSIGGNPFVFTVVVSDLDAGVNLYSSPAGATSLVIPQGVLTAGEHYRLSITAQLNNSDGDPTLTANADATISFSDVPEPASLCLLGVGALLGLRRPRRRRLMI